MTSKNRQPERKPKSSGQIAGHAAGQDTVSKSQRKRNMHELQAMGEALIRLPSGELDRIDMPDLLRDAVIDAQHMNKRGALNRQKQFIGKLMRKIDPQPIQDALEKLEHDSAEQKRRLHAREQWRDRLICEGDTAVGELCAAYPDCDRQHLRQLIRTVQAEKQHDKPPAASRKLFQYLKALIK